MAARTSSERSTRAKLHVVSGEPPRQVIVIGGGIAGLSAAHLIATEAGPDAAITVLEAGDVVGGKLRVGEVAGVLVDEGAEAMLATRPEAVSLAREVGLDRDIVHPEVFRSALWVRGALRPMPPSIMGIPTDLRALAAAQVLSARALVRLPLDYVRAATAFDQDVSVGDFVTARLGREVVDHLVEPLLGGVYAGRADALSMAATVPALFRELSQEPSVLRAAARTMRGGGRKAGARRGPMMAGIRGGVGRLPLAVADDLRRRGAVVRTGAAVSELRRHGEQWRVRLAGGELLTADEVVLAVPPMAASDLLAEVSPRASNELGLIDTSNMAIVTMAYPAAAVPPLSGSGFLVPPTEGRVMKAANFATSKWNWVAREAGTMTRDADAKVLIRVSVGRLGDDAALDFDDADLIAAVHRELGESVGVAAAPVASRVVRWRGGLPQYATGHVARVARIRAAVADVPNLEVCGAAFDGVGVAAVIGTARAAGRTVAARIAPAARAAGATMGA